jgi:hypothetical protein
LFALWNPSIKKMIFLLFLLGWDAMAFFWVLDRDFHWDDRAFFWCMHWLNLPEVGACSVRKQSLAALMRKMHFNEFAGQVPCHFPGPPNTNTTRVY